MKTVATFAALALACALAGCASNKANDTAAPGAVNGKACCAEGAAKGAACCKEGEKAAAPGAVNGAGCSKTCTDKAAAPGAVSGSGCSKTCGDKTAAPGAVSGKAEGCCKSKAGCSSAK
ncbi:MAG: hypothetical protein JNL80_08460 [Phycisphaerae bacterium]|nr:hypothetical protein [Phycisphaerae bacterium]